MNSNLDIELIANLNATFEGKNWNKIFHYKEFFERYCAFLENLDDEELKLVLKLTNNYEWITDNQYSGLLINALKKLESFKYLNFDTVYILPLLSKKDREKNKDKSSKLVAYLCNNVQLKYIPIFAGTKFQLIDNLNHLPKASKISANKNPIILVDDYVGTGETACDAIDELYEHRDYDRDFVFILSLVTQNYGLKSIQDNGFNMLYSELKNKGITDNFNGEEGKEMLATMQKLETKLSVDSDYQLGYKGSEALITMIRTPNNTFPIYWHEPKMKNGKKWVSPFPRN